MDSDKGEGKRPSRANLQKSLVSEYDKCYKRQKDFVEPWASPSEKMAWYKMKQTIANFYLQEIAGKKKVSVLDLGCGFGSDIFMLDLKTPKGVEAEFVGVDISREGIQKAKETAKKFSATNCTFINGNVETIDLKRKFDVIISSETFEHVINSADFLENIKRHLKGDGTIILSTPNDGNYPRKFLFVLPTNFVKGIKTDQEWQYKKYNNYKDAFDVDVSIKPVGELVAMFKKHGLEVRAKRRGTLVYGGEWLDKRPFLFSGVMLAEAVIPASLVGFGWDTVLKLKPREG